LAEEVEDAMLGRGGNCSREDEQRNPNVFAPNRSCSKGPILVPRSLHFRICAVEARGVGHIRPAADVRCFCSEQQIVHREHTHKRADNKPGAAWNAQNNQAAQSSARIEEIELPIYV
jgi:hypothetical protein